MNEKIQTRLEDARACFDEAAAFLSSGCRELKELQSLLEQALPPEPAPEPQPGPAPTRPPKPPESGGWPDVPRVVVGIQKRGERGLRPFVVGSPVGWSERDDGLYTGWIRGTDGKFETYQEIEGERIPDSEGSFKPEDLPYRWERVYLTDGELAVFVWREQWRGLEATRVTVWLVNGFAGKGTIYLERVAMEVDGRPTLALTGPDVIVPRGILPMEIMHGEPAATDAAERWRHVRPLGPTLPWMPGLARKGHAAAAESARRLGSYLVGDPAVKGEGSLNGSHGGWKLAPYWGGRDGWQATCAEGLEWMAFECRAQIGRNPIACLDPETGEPKNPHAPYWQGRTSEHELPGFKYVAATDGWCPYEAELRQYRAHDHTHYARAFTAAAAVARWSAPARTWLAWCWNDVACALDGAASPYGLLQPIYQWMLRAPRTGDHRAGRGLAHQIRCFLEAEPWLSQALDATSWGEPWREALRKLLMHVTMPNGVALAAGQGAWPDSALTKEAGLVDPIAASREIDLLGANFARLGLGRLHEAWRRFMAPREDGAGWSSVGDRLEVRPNATHWSQTKNYKLGAQPEYDLFRATAPDDLPIVLQGGMERICSAQVNASPNEPLIANLQTAVWQAWHRGRGPVVRDSNVV